MKKRKFILIFLTFFFFHLNSNGFSSKIVLKKFNLPLKGKVGEGILNYPGTPVFGYNISVGDDNFFYFYDSKGKYPFYALEKKSLKLKEFGSWGQGPGEIPQSAFVILSIDSSNIYVHLPFLMKILIFGKDLNFLKEIKGKPLELGSIFYIVGEREGIYVSSLLNDSGRFGERFRIDESLSISPVSINYGEYGKLKSIEPLGKNPMLKKGPIHVDSKGNIYFAHYYSSLIMGFYPDGRNIFINFSPRNIEIPEADLKAKGGIITGDPEKSIQSYLSLSSDDKYLYGLFSGEEISMEKIIAFRTGKLKELHLGEGKFVDVFERKDCKYLLSFELPVFATSIHVDKDYLYITTSGDSPCVMIFKKPNF